MAKLQRCEVWSSYACNAGVRTAVAAKVLRCEGREALEGTDQVEVDVPAGDAVASVQARAVLRLVFDDATFTEWRVRSVRESNGPDGAAVTITAITPLQDMADTGAISELSAAGMPQFLIGLSLISIEQVLDNYILPHLAASGLGYFAKGTIEPTELYDVQLFKMTPLAALRYLCDLARDETTKRPAELRVRRNGTTSYLIDVLRSIGSTAPVADLRYKKNLRRTELTTDSERQATVMQPFGATFPDGTPSGIARVAFRLGTPTGLVYPITDPEGGPSPVLFADQLTGYFVVPDQAGTDPAPPEYPLIEITASAPGSPATVTLADDTGITAGRVYELRKNSDGEFLSEMPSSTTITERKVQFIERSDVLGARNLVGNGHTRLWPDPDEPPTDCLYYPDTPSASLYVSQNTDPLYTQLGGKSLHIDMQDLNTGASAGLRYPKFFPAAKEGLQLHASKVRVFFKRFTGAAWLFLEVRDGVTGAVIEDADGREMKITLVPPNNPLTAGSVPTIGSWVDVSLINVDLLDYNLRGVELWVRASAGYGGSVEGSVDCYIDAVQVTQNIGEAPESYIEYSGSNALWREGNRVLETFTQPPEHYEIDVDDLTRADGTAFPFDVLTLGGTVRLTDSTLSLNGELLRLVEKPLVDYLHPKRTQIKVASRWEQFVELAVPGGASLGVATKPTVTPGEPPVTPPQPPGDPGVPLGTPGNWSHAFVTEAGGTFVLGAHGSAAESLGTGMYRRNLRPGSFIRGQATVAVAGYVTAYLDCRVSLDDGATWETDLLGIRIPLKDVKHAVGFAVEVPVDFQGDVLLDAVVVGGNDDAAPEILNFIVESTSAEPPPADGEDEPITPEIPQYASLLAQWDLTEGSGDSVANKKTGSGGVPALQVGSAVGADGNDTTWATGPRRMVCPSLPSFQHTYCQYVFSAGEAAALPNGFAWFFPFKHTAGPGDKFACAIYDPATAARLAHIVYDNVATKHFFAQLLQAVGGGTVATAGPSTTPMVLGDWNLLGVIYTGSDLKLVVNGVVEASVAVTTLFTPTTGTLITFGWPGTNLSFTVGPDNCDWGDPLVYVAAGIDFTDEELLAMYLQFRIVYTDLPDV